MAMFASLSCDIVDHRCYLISLILLEISSHDDTETDNVNVAKVSYASSPTDEMYLSSLFKEMSSFSHFVFLFKACDDVPVVLISPNPLIYSEYYCAKAVHLLELSKL